MWKTVLAGITALAIVGVTLGYDFAQIRRPSARDITAFGEGRIATLHAGLRLTAEQEKIGPPSKVRYYS